MEKRVLITAAAGGIGAAIARSAKTDGYDVVISDIDTAGGEKLASEIGQTFIACNLANEAEVVALVAKTGAVDLLVNNGGIAGPTAPVAELRTEDWNLVFAINATATFIACREMVRLMRPKGHGVIINMASVAAKIGYPNRAAYAASKRAVLGLTASLAREVGPDGIRVNAILPGTVRGERIDGVIARFAEANKVSIDERANLPRSPCKWPVRRRRTRLRHPLFPLLASTQPARSRRNLSALRRFRVNSR